MKQTDMSASETSTSTSTQSKLKEWFVKFRTGFSEADANVWRVQTRTRYRFHVVLCLFLANNKILQ